jgi:hypothetical protein
MGIGLLLIVNVGDRLMPTVYSWQQQHKLPVRILVAAVSYILVLYLDCRRQLLLQQRNQLPLNHHHHHFMQDFIPALGAACLYVLPVYPFLAVLISFGFMLVMDVFELFRLPLDWLNAPIYYGTLYGPFSVVYFRVKKAVVYDDRAGSYLPT